MLVQHFDSCRFEGRAGQAEICLRQPGLLVLTVTGELDSELVSRLFDVMDGVYAYLTEQNRQAWMLIDCLGVERLSLSGQRALLARKGRSNPPAGIISFHCLFAHPVLKRFVNMLLSLNAGLRERVKMPNSLPEAMAQLVFQLQSHGTDALGPELLEEALQAEHTRLQYFQPSPQMLICRGQGITNVVAAEHMLRVHGRHLKAQRQAFGRGILILDMLDMRHCTMEAYRLMRSQSGPSRPGPGDCLIVMVPRFHKAVNSLIRGMSPGLGFTLEVVDSLDAALEAARRFQAAPERKAAARKPRQPWWKFHSQLRELQTENASLRQERDNFLSQAGSLLNDILLQKAPKEMLKISEQDLQGPYQDIYESLYLLQQEHQEYFGTLQQEISERIQAEQKAAELSQIKSRFLANVSHELRTPMNAIMGFTRLMLRGKGGDLSPQHQQYTQRVHDNSQHLLMLINDVLDISKIEAGTLLLRRQPLEMKTFLQESLEPLQLLAQQKQLPLQLDIDPQAAEMLNTDPDRLRQLVTNLVSNALKFTNQGSVSVNYRRWPSKLYPLALEIQDTGMGIAKADQKRIFEAFTQAHDGSYAGAGLGLSICLSLTNLLNYKLELESVPGQGSVFRLLISLEAGG